MTIASSTLSTKVKEGGRWRGSVDKVDEVDSLYRQLKPLGTIHRLGGNLLCLRIFDSCSEKFAIMLYNIIAFYKSPKIQESDTHDCVWKKNEQMLKQSIS